MKFLIPLINNTGTEDLIISSISKNYITYYLNNLFRFTKQFLANILDNSIEQL